MKTTAFELRCLASYCLGLGTGRALPVQDLLPRVHATIPTVRRPCGDVDFTYVPCCHRDTLSDPEHCRWMMPDVVASSSASPTAGLVGFKGTLPTGHSAIAGARAKAMSVFAIPQGRPRRMHKVK